VRIELDDRFRAAVQRQLLFDFGDVAMFHQTVRLHALSTLNVQVHLVNLSAGAADATARIHDDVLATDHARLEQRNQRNEDARRITAGRGHELSLGFPSGRSQLGQDEARTRKQLGCVVFAVIFLVRGEIGDAKVRAQIDHALPGRHERLGVGRRGPMRQCQKKEIDVARRERRGIGVGELQAAIRTAHGRNHHSQCLARIRARGDDRECDLRMTEEQFDQYFARVTGRTDDTDFHGRRNVGS